jgi:hypothetical protein
MANDFNDRLVDLSELEHVYIMANGEEYDEIIRMYALNPQHVYTIFLDKLTSNNGNGDWLYDLVHDTDDIGLQEMWARAYHEYLRIRREQVKHELAQSQKKKRK